MTNLTQLGKYAIRRELGKGASYVGIAFALSLIVGWTMTAAGLDPRELLLGTYVQRNSLVVGFVMGFAVIPIIYTVTEDALAHRLDGDAVVGEDGRDRGEHAGDRGRDDGLDEREAGVAATGSKRVRGHGGSPGQQMR